MLNIISDSISIPAVGSDKKPIHYKYKKIENNIGQDFYYAIRPVEYLLGKDSKSQCAVRLPIDWVVSGPLLPCFNRNTLAFNVLVS